MKNIHLFENGNLRHNNVNVNIDTINWVEHASFKGVYLKNLLTGINTGGIFSSHLVKIEPGAEIGLHIHKNNAELHEVIEGNGVCMLDKQDVPYFTGVSVLIEKSINHRVMANNSGLFLFAKFFPALV